MKKTAVIGLGIIGGSICKALAGAGYFVAGRDIDKSTLSCALKEGVVREEAQELSRYDTVFLAVPPRAALALLEEGDFKEDALVADICGVKAEMEKAVYSRPRKYRYVGLHPMAGKETNGLSSSSADLFVGANLVVVLSRNTKESALKEVLEYAKAMGFGRITQCSAQEHDRKIALTSQLAHLVSNAYVKSPEVKDCEGFTGGSFQDMTRIAGVDEAMWSQLYLFNRENILSQLDGLIEHLSEYREAIFEGKEERLKAQLKAGRLLREAIKSEKS
ncbi:MAG: prephenate dehydrogenase [Firmicutes bacterium]|nr:prephenate dehydrogenase [Bacillota bacterium]